MEIVLNSKVYTLGNDSLNKTNVATSNGVKYILKRVDNNTLVAHRDILKTLESVAFARLVLPKFVDAGTVESSQWLVLEYLEGDDYHSRWNEHMPEISGGRAINLSSVDTFLDLVEDLIGIDVSTYLSTEVKKLDPSAILNQFESSSIGLLEKNWITLNQLSKARELIDNFTKSLDNTFQISNGDFQFRNFIDLADGKIGLVDWEGCRLSPFELEHMIAYQWILMWNNSMWQKKLIQEAKQRFSLDKVRFQCTLLFDALNQAAGWSNDLYLGRIQIDYFINSLNQNYIDFLFDN